MLCARANCTEACFVFGFIFIPNVTMFIGWLSYICYSVTSNEQLLPVPINLIAKTLFSFFVKYVSILPGHPQGCVEGRQRKQGCLSVFASGCLRTKQGHVPFPQDVTERKTLYPADRE